MNSFTHTERAVIDLRQAAFELSATDQKQACLLLGEALKLQPGHAELLGDLAVLHLQGGRHSQCIQAASEALAAEPLHDESAYALALALEATGQFDKALERYAELAVGHRAERFRKNQPELAALCQTKLEQLGHRDASAPQTASLPTTTNRSMAMRTPAATQAVEPTDRSDSVYAPMLIRAGSLGQLLSETRGIKALTLDCFDTILWRHTDKPVDVFFDLQQRPAFKAANIDAPLREQSERYARRLQWVRTGRTEVSLEQIYLAARPELGSDMLRWLAEDELAAEMHACHAHPGAVRLLRDAKARGLPVTIISDTYFDGERLRRLLSHALPADAYAAIGEVICSADHGVSKGQGLFKLARLNQLSNSPAVLHVGDNKDADVRAPGMVGMSATHLMHEGGLGEQRRRMGAAIVSLLDPSARSTRALYMPYRPIHAAAGNDNPAARTAIGHSALGPLMHAFGRWIEEEALSLSATRDRVKLVFLMRDAYLPLETYRAIDGQVPAYSAQISRFSAYAASFRRQEHVDHYLAQFAQGLTPDMIARQLLLCDETAQRLIEQAESTPQPLQSFLAALRKPEVLAEILVASAAFRERLRRYLARQVSLEPGDTLVLVDVGYAGTIQKVLGPVIREEWGTEVYGRYLLAVGSVNERHKGLLDRTWLDPRALDTLQPYVAPLEALSADQGASAVGYEDDGEPIFESEQIDDAQRTLVFEIQNECVRFAREAEAYFRAVNRAPPSTILRDEALASLGRLMFLPSKLELEHLSRFKLEINLGTGIARQLFDVEAGMDGLRRHGLFYGQTQSVARMSVPAELRAAGLELSLSLLAQSRFGLDLNRTDWAIRKSTVQLLLARDSRSAEASVDATPTHDGYFCAVIPLPGAGADVALALGRDHEWLQLHSADLVPVSDRRVDEGSDVDARSMLAYSGVQDHGRGLLQFADADALIMLPAGSWSMEGKVALRIVFRPIAPRSDAVPFDKELVVRHPAIAQ